ncbi:serine hydrolase domain-containing protein [Paenibacillus physcomitrellae]|uniref:6-aminohexanoate-dimer hydrolase n=1 Tax=Paenibacillus physcomitrellae TaxID=1619311 RepID=A0ABQ1FPW6_9BACL|nr:serine hydrolase [Paenibacillus physcomitrellae]GGA24361.1 6-aminohexanoate-dimer hydrolase [Paenibacillus physcomitrellae]
MDLTQLSSAIAPVNLRSCLIQQQGKLIFEHYRRPQTFRETAKINSCTKSILSSLLCIAMDQGLLPALSTPASAFFPQLASAEDSRKQKITLEHLLTMTAGFSWTEFGGKNSFPHMTRTPDWIAYVLDQPLADEPGTRMEYNSGVSQMLSHILVQVSGMSTADFAEKYLFGPLGINHYEWETDPQGVHTGGFGLKLRPADLMKFGQLYLDKGRWQGEPLISSPLLERSVQPAIAVNDPWRGYYCWHWWADTYPGDDLSDPAASFEYFYARGFGGQFVHVIPKLDMVVVLTHDNRKNSKYPDVFRAFIAPLLIGEPVSDIR